MNIDEQFLESVGLSSMPESEKHAFLAHVQDELEIRIGAKMSEGLSPAQLDEFEKLSEKDQTILDAKLAENPDYQNDPVYQQLLQKHNVSTGESDILAEYLQVKWIEKNRPDYRNIVKNTFDELKQEIYASKDEILR